MYPHLAIAILNYNGKKYLEQYLPSVMAATYPNKSVWVIDNQSTDDSLAFLAAHYPAIKLVVNEGNMGFAAGYNKGLEAIAADYYLLLNSDVEVTPGFIEPIIKLMEQDHSIAFAQPKVRWLRKRELFEYAGAAGGTMDALGYPFCRGRVLEDLETDNGQYDDTVPIFWASGACMFARASVYKELNGMYEFFYMQNEEIDLCWRAQNLGYKIYTCGASTVYHLGGGSLEWTNPRKTYFTFRNNLVMNTRNMPIGRLLWLIPLRTGLDNLAAIRYVFGGKANIGGAVFKGIFAYWKWLFFGDRQNGNHQSKWPLKRGLKNCAGVFNGSIVWNYFVTKKRKYGELMKP
ncbi:MAG: glycosyltransferase family 2 protein [Chitinophagaceae bacterium]